MTIRHDELSDGDGGAHCITILRETEFQHFQLRRKLSRTFCNINYLRWIGNNAKTRIECGWYADTQKTKSRTRSTQYANKNVSPEELKIA